MSMIDDYIPKDPVTELLDKSELRQIGGNKHRLKRFADGLVCIPNKKEEKLPTLHLFITHGGLVTSRVLGAALPPSPDNKAKTRDLPWYRWCVDGMRVPYEDMATLVREVYIHRNYQEVKVFYDTDPWKIRTDESDENILQVNGYRPGMFVWDPKTWGTGKAKPIKKGSNEALMRDFIIMQAGGDVERAEEFLRWLAWSIKNPFKVNPVMYIISGDKGTGKSMLLHLLVALHRDYGNITDQEKGHFSSEEHPMAFLGYDEMTQRGGNFYKTLLATITQETRKIERKYAHRRTFQNIGTHMGCCNATYGKRLQLPDRDERRVRFLRPDVEVRDSQGGVVNTFQELWIEKHFAPRGMLDEEIGTGFNKEIAGQALLNLLEHVACGLGNYKPESTAHMARKYSDPNALKDHEAQDNEKLAVHKEEQEKRFFSFLKHPITFKLIPDLAAAQHLPGSSHSKAGISIGEILDVIDPEGIITNKVLFSKWVKKYHEILGLQAVNARRGVARYTTDWKSWPQHLSSLEYLDLEITTTEGE